MSIASASRTATDNRWATRHLPCSCRLRSWETGPSRRGRCPRSLRACLWPDQRERVARLKAEMALAATAPPLLLQGDAVEVVPDAFARVPADALPVVTTTWALRTSR